jgi:hypothetical protein
MTNEKPENVRPAGQIYALIPRIMQEVGAIGKGRKNAQQNYSFRGIDDLYNALQGPLSRHGVFYVPEVTKVERSERVTRREGGRDSVLFYTILTVRFTFYAPDASSVAVVTVGEAMDSGDKSANKAMSAALKYALLQMFCVPTEEQQDTEYASHDVAPRDALEDADVFNDALDAAFKARGFNPEQADAAIGAVLRKKRVGAVERLALADRHAFLANIADGSLDKFKAAPAKEELQPA